MNPDLSKAEVAFLWRDTFFKTKPLRPRVFSRCVQDGMYWYPTEIDFFKQYNIEPVSKNIISFKEFTRTDKVLKLPHDYCDYNPLSEAL